MQVAGWAGGKADTYRFSHGLSCTSLNSQAYHSDTEATEAEARNPGIFHLPWFVYISARCTPSATSGKRAVGPPAPTLMPSPEPHLRGGVGPGRRTGPVPRVTGRCAWWWILAFEFATIASCSRFILLGNLRLIRLRRGAGVAEQGCLLSSYTGKTGVGGSNPPLSAISFVYKSAPASLITEIEN